FGDVDDDGDLDWVVGGSDGTLSYFKNEGSKTSPSFEEITDGTSPFDGIDVGKYSVPAFIDYDDDGDLDLVVGCGSGTLFFFKNTAARRLGEGRALSDISYEEQTGSNNPYNGITTTGNSAPAVGDIDGDGQDDLILADGSSGEVSLYINS
ncbi:unnamed protein product, partial [Heterosigma akashiwo]